MKQPKHLGKDLFFWSIVIGLPLLSLVTLIFDDASRIILDLAARHAFAVAILAAIVPAITAYALAHSSIETAKRDEVALKSVLLNNYFKHKEEYIKQFEKRYERHVDIRHAHRTLFSGVIRGDYSIDGIVLSDTQELIERFLTQFTQIGANPLNTNETKRLKRWMEDAAILMGQIKYLGSIHPYFKFSTYPQLEVDIFCEFICNSLDFIAEPNQKIVGLESFQSCFKSLSEEIQRCENFIISIKEIKDMLQKDEAGLT